jgi:hypothetical protein
MSHELDRYGTGLFAVGFSPIQKIVVTMFVRHGNCLVGFATGISSNVRSVGAQTEGPAAVVPGMLLFRLGVIDVCASAEGRESAASDRSAAAAVWVIVPRFINAKTTPENPMQRLHP